MFNEIIENIKDILSLKKGNKKVFDKDVAIALCINQKTFATMKKRGSPIPVKEIISFAKKHKISLNLIFIGRDFEEIVNKIGE